MSEVLDLEDYIARGKYIHVRILDTLFSVALNNSSSLNVGIWVWGKSG